MNTKESIVAKSHDHEHELFAIMAVLAACVIVFAAYREFLVVKEVTNGLFILTWCASVVVGHALHSILIAIKEIKRRHQNGG